MEGLTSENSAPRPKTEIEAIKAELKRLEGIEVYKTVSDPHIVGNAERLRQNLMARHRETIRKSEESQ